MVRVLAPMSCLAVPRHARPRPASLGPALPCNDRFRPTTTSVPTEHLTAAASHCSSTNRRRFRTQGHYDAYRCRACDGYYTLLSGSAFGGSRQRPATLVILLRGITKGEPTARLARELQLSRQTIYTMRQRIQADLDDSAPTETMDGTTFEVDEIYQNAGEKSTPHRSPDDPPRRRAGYPLGEAARPRYL